MSILGSIKSAAKKVVSTVGGLLGGSKNTAAATMAFPTLPGTTLSGPNQTLVPNISTPQGLGQTQPNGSIVLLTRTGTPTGVVTQNSSTGTNSVNQLSSSVIGGGSTGVSGSWTTPSTNFLSSTNQSSFTTPSTISAQTGTSTTPAIALPSTPGVKNPGIVNNAGLANGTLKYNAATNTLESIAPTTVAMTPEEQAKIQADILRRELDLVPQKENVLQSPEVIAQNAEVQRQQQQVNDYTAQLNSITAKQQQDLLQLQGVGSKEGVTEAVYGGQAAEINREAAIRALPVQASLAAAQGNLGLAQDYLKQITALKTEQITNDYAYRAKVYDAITNYVDKEQSRILDAKKTAANQQFQLTLANMNDVHGYASSLLSSNPGVAGKLLSLNPNSPTYLNDANNLIKTVTPKDSGGGTSSFVDVMQQAIDAGASPEQAAREAATVSENTGIQVDQVTLNGWVAQARKLKPNSAPVAPSVTTETPATTGLIDKISNFLFGK